MRSDICKQSGYGSALSEDSTAANGRLLLPVVHLVVFLIGLHMVDVSDGRASLHLVSKRNFVSFSVFVNSVPQCVLPLYSELCVPKKRLLLALLKRVLYLPTDCYFCKVDVFKIDLRGRPDGSMTVPSTDQH